jgi:alkylation response protein AidB-like acyl-CoA dehydrogenase
VAEPDDQKLDLPIREYLDRAFDERRRLGMLTGTGTDRDFLRAVAAQGWFSLAIPESYGGLGLPLADLAPVFVALGEYLVPGPIVENCVLPSLLVERASAEGRSALLATVEDGAPVGLVAPHTGSTWADQLGSVRCTDGKLDGEMSLVRFGEQAELLVVVANDERTVCLVDPRTDGVTVVADGRGVPRRRSGSGVPRSSAGRPPKGDRQ